MSSKGSKPLELGQGACFHLPSEGLFLLIPISIFPVVQGAMSSCTAAVTVEVGGKNRRFLLVAWMQHSPTT